MNVLKIAQNLSGLLQVLHRLAQSCWYGSVQLPKLNVELCLTKYILVCIDRVFITFQQTNIHKQIVLFQTDASHRVVNNVFSYIGIW